MSQRRQDAGAAVAGLFDRPSATGGLAGQANGAARHRTTDTARPRPDEPAVRSQGADRSPPPVSTDRDRGAGVGALARVRLGVELTEEQTAYLRALSRPGRTGAPRTLGSKFVATGVLAAAIELLQGTHVDMHGVTAGDEPEMRARARAALIRAAQPGGQGDTA